MPEIGLELRQYPDKVVRVAPWVSKWMTPLDLKSRPSWLVGPSGLAWDLKEWVEWGQLGYDISSGQGPQRRNPQHQQQQGFVQKLGQLKQQQQMSEQQVR